MTGGNEGPREICCCGSYSWAKIIGVIQVIIYTLSIIGSVLLLSGVIHVRTAEGTTEKAEKEHQTLSTIALVIQIISLIFFLVGFVTGILLIKGANEKNTSYLTVWIVFAVVCYIWGIVQIAVGSASFVYTIVNLAVLTAIYGFGMWVVSVLKGEIRAGVYATDAPPMKA